MPRKQDKISGEDAPWQMCCSCKECDAPLKAV